MCIRDRVILLQSLNIFLQALHILVSKLIQCQFHAYQFFADSSQAVSYTHLNTVIQRNVKLSEAPSYGLPTILYDADSTGATNHMALAKALISRNEKK